MNHILLDSNLKKIRHCGRTNLGGYIIVRQDDDELDTTVFFHTYWLLYLELKYASSQSAVSPVYKCASLTNLLKVLHRERGQKHIYFVSV